MSFAKRKAKAEVAPKSGSHRIFPFFGRRGNAASITKEALVEALAKDILGLCSRVQSLIAPYSDPTIASSGEALHRIQISVDEILLRADLQRGEFSPESRDFGELEDIHAALKALLSGIEKYSGPDNFATALEPFNETAKKWLLDLNTRDGLGPRDTDSTDIPASSLTPPGGERKCPLEIALRRAGYLNDEANNLGGFLGWAHSEKAFSNLHLEIGVVKSVHLFRHQKAPFYHEYTLICLEGPDIPQSWIRVERAARFKVNNLRPQADSLAPLFAGVALRESVSFGISKEDLNSNSIEYAAIVIEEPRLSEVALFLYEVAQQISNTSSAYPAYQLFTANCRYFARSLVYNIAQRFGDLVVKPSWKGKPSSLQRLYTKLKAEQFGGHQLEGERASLVKAANKLELARAQHFSSTGLDVRLSCSEAESILHSVKTDSPHRQYLLALSQHIRADISAASGHSNSLQSAFDHDQRASNIARPIRSESTDFEVLYLDTVEGMAFYQTWSEQLEAAVSTRQEVIDGWRQEMHKGNSSATLNLARVLSQQAFDLIKVPSQRLHAVTTITEAGVLARQAYTERPDFARPMIPKILDQYCTVLADADDPSGALKDTLESVALVREIFSAKPERHTSQFHSYIRIQNNTVVTELVPRRGEHFEDLVDDFRVKYNNEREVPRVSNLLSQPNIDLAIEAITLDYKLDANMQGLADALGLQAKSYLPNDPLKALGPAQESVSLFEKLVSLRPWRHRGSLMQAMRTHANIMEFAGDIQGAFRVSQQYIVQAREEFANRDKDQVHAHLARSLRTLASYARKLGLWDEACEAHRESVEHYRLLYTKEPDEKRRDKLANALSSYSSALKATHDFEAAFSASEESVTLTREIYDASGDTDARLDLADRLYNHANHARKLKRWSEVVKAREESADHYRNLRLESPEAHRIDFADCLLMLAGDLKDVDRATEAVKPMAEAVKLFRVEYASHDSREKLADILTTYANILHKSEDSIAAIAVLNESISLTREISSAKISVCEDLADRLDIRARYERAQGLWDDAVISREESVDNYRKLHKTSPKKYGHDLAKALRRLGGDLKRAGRASDGKSMVLEAANLSVVPEIPRNEETL